MVLRRIPFLPGVLCLALAAASFASAQSGRTSGTYKDASGKLYAWSVNAGHTLTWDGSPYTPVGGCFTPRSLRPNATADDWTQDEHALDVLRAHGALDILIRPVASAVDIPAAAWQRLIDRLEAGGFRYGIAFGAGVTDPLAGTLVRPSSYRTSRVTPGSEVTWTAPGATSAYYVIVNETDGTDIYAKGRTDVVDGLVSVTAGELLGDGAIGLLYPHKTLKRTSSSGMPDLWQGFDTYRDRLLSTFGGVHFGPGLRFFLDPLAGPLALGGEFESFIPDSPGFRLEWEAWLERNYHSVDDLEGAWTLNDTRFKTFRELAALVPLWYGTKGVPFFLDPATGKTVALGSGSPRFWSDLKSFENRSISYYMNTLADVLKREVADVPVLYTHTAFSSVFTNPAPDGGFDGLGSAAYGQGTALITEGVDTAVSQAMDCARPMWLVVTQTADTDPEERKATPGYASQQSMAYDYQWLKQIGVKGIFAYAYQAAPDDQRTFDLVSVPQQLDWLRAVAGQIYAGAGSSADQVRLLPYPSSAAGLVHPGPIPNTGVWWAPSMAPGSPIEFGSSYAGYTIKLPPPDGEVTVMWSRSGPRETRLFAMSPKIVTVTTADGQPIQTRPNQRGRFLAFQMPDGPVILHTSGQPVYPLEAVDDAIRQLQALVRQGQQARLPMQTSQYLLERSQTLARSRDMGAAYIAAQQGLVGAIATTLPYSWVEADTASPQTFSEVTPNAGASGGALLTLHADTAPSPQGYTATISFKVPTDATYTVWLSCTPPGPHASPFLWSVDDGEMHISSSAVVTGEQFLAEQLVWLKLGDVKLKRGNHTFTIRVKQTAPGSSRYLLALDALLVTRGVFHPDGISKPSLSDLPSLPPAPVVPGAVDLNAPLPKPGRR